MTSDVGSGPTVSGSILKGQFLDMDENFGKCVILIETKDSYSIIFFIKGKNR